VTDFNLRSCNSGIFPGIAPLVARRQGRGRIRVATLSTTNHPIHPHGHAMQVSGTDAARGALPAAASHAAHNPSNDVAVRAKKPDRGGVPMEH
jgi:FtsP/CotA-like multicopper oxidase with cupredoxin domain